MTPRLPRTLMTDCPVHIAIQAMMTMILQVMTGFDSQGGGDGQGGVACSYF